MPEKLEQVVSEIQALGGSARAVPGDASVEADPGRFPGRARQRQVDGAARARHGSFTGASGSLHGRSLFAAFAAAKAGLRATVQSMACELGPKGTRVAHVVIDGGIEGERLLAAFPDRNSAKGPEGLLSIDAIAETYGQLHQLPRSAWTHELELRPWTASF